MPCSLRTYLKLSMLNKSPLWGILNPYKILSLPPQEARYLQLHKQGYVVGVSARSGLGNPTCNSQDLKWSAFPLPEGCSKPGQHANPLGNHLGGSHVCEGGNTIQPDAFQPVCAQGSFTGSTWPCPHFSEIQGYDSQKELHTHCTKCQFCGFTLNFHYVKYNTFEE